MFISFDDLGISYKKREPDPKYAEIAEQVYDEFADYLMSLQGWNVLSGFGKFDRGGLDEPREETREHLIKRSRVLARKEPLSKQAVRLYTTYSGILRVEFKSKRPELEALWREKCWDLVDNNFVLGPLHRRKLSNRILSDGELFFTLFTNDDGSVRVRTVDTLEIPTDGLITHPDDKDMIIYFKRTPQETKSQQQGSTNAAISGIGAEEDRYYRNVLITDEALAAIEASIDKPLLPEGKEEETTDNGKPVLMYHVPFDVFGVRGNGLLFSVVSYVENYRDFLQNRATIVKALATYIRKITVEGGSIGVKDIASRLRSSLSSGNTWYEQNPPDAVGAAWVQNKQLDMEPLTPSSGGGEALQDARIFRQPISSGTGITEPNLTGDPSVGNLASQVQMEGPQLQNFLDYQLLWEVVFKELWQFVLIQNEMSFVVSDLDVFLPPVIIPAMPDLISALQFGLETTTVPFREVSRSILIALGARDVDKLMDEAEKEKEEKREVANQISSGDNQSGGVSPNIDNASNTGKENVISREISEEHNELTYEGICPFCGSEGKLKESHSLVVCYACKATFNPKYHLENWSAEEDDDTLDASVYNHLITEGVSKEAAIAMRDFLLVDAERNGNVTD